MAAPFDNSRRPAAASRAGRAPERRRPDRVSRRVRLIALAAVPLCALLAVQLPARAAPARRTLPGTPRVGSMPAPACRPWSAGTYAVGQASPILVSTCATATGFTGYVVWIDHATTRLALYPGLSDPSYAAPRGTGEIPFGQRWRLLAAFNSGFKTSAGAGGFLVNGHVDDPLQNGLGTLVETRDGSVGILDWRGRTSPARLVLARQNLPPLVWNGTPNATVADVPAWGATLGGGAAVWRTALGVTAQGDLVYAAAGAQTPASLASLIIRIGAVRAIELDINPEWPSFVTYRRRGGADPKMVVPNPQEPSNRYLTPDSRDFFVVYTRAGGGPFVPFR
jgi:hypothetical protein